MRREAAATPASEHQLLQALVIGLCLMLVVCLLASGLLAFALQQQALPLPTFSVKVGKVQFAAPCPQAFQCDINQPYYAIWRGDDLPNGTIHFQELYFTWLPKKHP